MSVLNPEPLHSRPVHSQPADQWSKYNTLQVEDQFRKAIAENENEFQFYVSGLRCASCVHKLENLPQLLPAVHYARVQFGKSLIQVRTSQTQVLGEISRAIENLGFQPTPLASESESQRAYQQENRTELKRIGVAAAVAGNEMLFAVPIYAGLSGSLGEIFKWISFFIFLPLILYSVQGIYRKAWAALKHRRLSVECMIVAALWSGFILSTYNLIQGGDQIYFDSTAGFIFLILSTRYLLRKYQEKFTPKDILSEMFAAELYELADRSGHISFSQLRGDERLILKQGQTLPADVRIDGEAEFDLSFLSGEAYPQKRIVGDHVPAGAKLLSADITAVCTGDKNTSALAKTLTAVKATGQSARYQSLTDTISHRLTVTVFTIAIGYFLWSFPSLGIEAFYRSLALITIACPCAVAFGTPLAQSLGVRKAVQNGFFVRSADAFEKTNTVQKVIFDKTGTLTSSEMKLIRTYPAEIPREIKQLILGLERHSQHPVAVGIRQAWSSEAADSRVEATEIAGQGVQAFVDGNLYALSRSEDRAHESFQVDLSLNGHKVAYLFFEESIRPESEAVVEELQQRQVQVMLLSGDQRQRTLEVARRLKVRPLHVFSEQTPESKMRLIEKENPCLYVGDGLNDLQALAKAHVSFAVRGPFEATYQVCDVMAPGKNLKAIVEFMNLSKNVYAVIQSNLLFALLYNSVGGVLALSGYINPLVAAVLMPLSSVLIIVHTVWRLK